MAFWDDLWKNINIGANPVNFLASALGRSSVPSAVRVTGESFGRPNTEARYDAYRTGGGSEFDTSRMNYSGGPASSYYPSRLASDVMGRTVDAQDTSSLPPLAREALSGAISARGDASPAFLERHQRGIFGLPQPEPEETAGFEPWSSGYYDWEPSNLRGQAASEVDMIIAEQLGAIGEGRADAEAEYQQILNALGAAQGESLEADAELREQLDLQRERRLASRGFDTGGAYRYNTGRGIEKDLARAGGIRRTYQTQAGAAGLERQSTLGSLGREASRVSGSREGLIAMLLRELEGESFDRYSDTLPYRMQEAQFGPSLEYQMFQDQDARDLAWDNASSRGGGGTDPIADVYSLINEMDATGVQYTQEDVDRMLQIASSQVRY